MLRLLASASRDLDDSSLVGASAVAVAEHQGVGHARPDLQANGDHRRTMRRRGHRHETPLLARTTGGRDLCPEVSDDRAVRAPHAATHDGNRRPGAAGARLDRGDRRTRPLCGRQRRAVGCTRSLPAVTGACRVARRARAAAKGREPCRLRRERDESAEREHQQDEQRDHGEPERSRRALAAWDLHPLQRARILDGRRCPPNGKLNGDRRARHDLGVRRSRSRKRRRRLVGCSPFHPLTEGTAARLPGGPRAPGTRPPTDLASPRRLVGPARSRHGGRFQAAPKG